MPVNIKKYSN